MKLFLKFRFLMLFLSVFSVFTAYAEDEDLTLFLPGEFKAIRKSVFKIMEHYPPDQYCYVGLGRSLTAQIAFFEVLKGNPDVLKAGISIEARNAPISLTMRKDDTSFVPTAIHPEQTEASRNNIKQWLLSVVERCKGKGRKTLFMDYANTGVGIGRVVEILGPPNDAWPFEFLVLRRSHHYFRKLPPAAHLTIWFIGGPLGEGLEFNAWKIWSEFPQWMPEERAWPDLTPSPLYAELKAYIARRLEVENTVGNAVRRLQRMCAGTLISKPRFAEHGRDGM